jgi:hypothetical protein
MRIAMGSNPTEPNQAPPSDGRRAEKAKASMTFSATVQKILPGVLPGQPDRAQIVVKAAEDLYKEIRIENALLDAEGNEVRLAPGTELEIVIQVARGDAVGEKPAI